MNTLGRAGTAHIDELGLAYNRSEPRSSRIAGAMLWGYRSHVLIVLDVLCIALACWLGHFVRFDFPSLALVVPLVPDKNPNEVAYLLASTMLTFTWAMMIWREGGYRSQLYSMSPLGNQLAVLFKSAFLAGGTAMIMLFLIRPIVVSRVFLFLTMFFGICFTVMIRAALVFFDKWLGSCGVVLNRLVVAGSGESIPPLVERLRNKNTSLGFTGVIELSSDAGRSTEASEDWPLLGSIEDIAGIYKEHPFDGMLFAANGYDFGCNPKLKESIIGAVNFCEIHEIPFYMLPHSLDVAVSRKEMGSLYGCPVIEIRDAARHPLYRWVKRIMDLTLAAFVLILGLPIWLTVALAVKLSGKGPVFFVQERVGLNGKRFRMYKFRTMVNDAEERLREIVDLDSLSDPVFKIRNDPRVTRVGRFLRRSGLDEIPQLINVLKGDMSIVGPRPEQSELVDRYDVWQRRRLKGLPGITGYQQVMARGIPSLAQRIEYDLHYLKNQSLSLDLLILLRTIAVIIKGQGIH